MLFKLKYILKFLYSEFNRKIMNPKEIRYFINIFKRERLLKFLDREAIKVGIGLSWKLYNSKSTFIKRSYKSYEEYIEHQKSKYEKIKDNISEKVKYDQKFRQVLHKRLINLEIIKSSMKVLCLGARYGSEVKVFLDISCFAVGIDLNPGKMNPHVLYGDFHDIQFPTNSVDIIYTNCLDHVFDMDEIIKEINRVLTLDGFLILDAVVGIKKKRYPGCYESFWWSKPEDLLTIFTNNNFQLISRSSFDFPWKGEQFLLKKRKKNNSIV